MRKIFLISSLALCGLTPLSAHAQMAVVDPQAIGIAIENQTQTLTQWAKQYQQLQQQYQQLQQQYAAITGNRGLASISDNAALHSYLPAGWQNQYNALRSNGLSGLSKEAQQIANSYQLFDRCHAQNNNQTQTLCHAQTAKSAQDLSFVNAALQKTTERMQQIQELMSKANTTTDQKGALEIQARLSAEQAMMKNEETKLNLFQASSKLQSEILEEQARQDHAQAIASKQGFNTVTVDFSGN